MLLTLEKISFVIYMNDYKFIPLKQHDGNIKTVYFVYETELDRLSQPFIRPIYYLHIVCSGTAMLKMAGKEYSLKRGDLFFAFPGCPYTIYDYNKFEFCYISFIGALKLLYTRALKN